MPEFDDINTTTNELSVPDHERSYEELRTIGMSLRKAGDTYDWKIGDLANELTERADRAKERYVEGGKKEDTLSPDDLELKAGGKKAMSRLADDLGIPVAQLAKRRHVSRVFPRGHKARKLKLSYSLVREISHVTEKEKREEYLGKAVDMTVAQVMEMVIEDRDTSAAQAGLLQCRRCNENIVDIKTMVKIYAEGIVSVFDTWQCVALYSQEKATEHGQRNRDAEMETDLGGAEELVEDELDFAIA